jgi:DNA-binding beta-propeller fold protein YncE
MKPINASLIARTGRLLSSIGFVFGWLLMLPVSGMAQTGTPTNTIVATISLPFDAATMVCSPDNKFVYVGGPSKQQAIPEICVIDATANQVISTFAIGAQYVLTVDDLAISPDGQTLYTSAANNTLIEASTVTQSVTATLPYGSQNVVMKPDGSQLWMIEGSLIQILDTQNNTLLSKPVKLPNFAESMTFTPDGTHAYVVYRNLRLSNYNVALVDCATEKILNDDIAGRRLHQNGLAGGDGVVMDPNSKNLYINVPYHLRADNPIGEVIKIFSMSGGPMKTIDSYGAVGATPDGRYLYAFGYTPTIEQPSSLVSIDTTTDQPVGPSLSLSISYPPEFAIRPDGKYAYVLDQINGTLTVINIQPSS